jgi:adenine-specific DNA-methyltransferase
MWFGKDGTARPRVKNYLSDSQGISSWTWWTNSEVGHNQEAKKEINVLFGADDAFDTPKPERLLKRIMDVATNSNDLILDSFLGSGTTAAVAHKMNRRYIGIEMGDHAQTHCQPRLQQVVEGEQGGISKTVNWTGGGGFRFYRLGSELFDEYGTINPAIGFASLAAHLWYMETRTPLLTPADSPLLGIHDGTAYYLLYNGILRDRRSQGGNVLTRAVLDFLPLHDGKKIIYGETSRLGPARMDAEQITFKQIPYDVRVA